MSFNRFLSSGNGTDLSALQDGSFDLNINSIRVNNLLPSQNVNTDEDRLLESGSGANNLQEAYNNSTLPQITTGNGALTLQAPAVPLNNEIIDIKRTDGVSVVKILDDGRIINPLSNVGIGSINNLANITTGTNNIALGNNALNANLEGSHNIGMGNLSLLSNTGSNNIALGEQACRSQSVASNNIAVGNSALRLNLFSNDNTSIGVASLENSLGNNNTAIGNSAGNTITNQNNTISLGSGSDCDTSNQCTIGNGSITVIRPLSNNVCDLGQSGTNEFKDGYFTGEMNIGSGIIDKTDFSVAGDQELISKKYVDDTNNLQESYDNSTLPQMLLGNGALTLQLPATPIGDEILDLKNTAGTSVFRVLNDGRIEPIGNNVSIGQDSMSLILNRQSIAIGLNALRNVTTAINNVGIGFNALSSNTVGIDNVGVGRDTLSSNTTGDDNVAVGHNTLLSNVSGDDNVSVGSAALSSNINGNANVAIGKNALIANTSGGGNVGIGFNALLSNDNGVNNTAIGRNSQMDTVNSFNTSIGAESLRNNTTGRFNIAIGSASMATNLTAGRNTCIGTDSLFFNVSGDDNTGIGYQSLHQSLAPNNTAVGSQSLSANTTGTRNVGIGVNSLISNTIGSNNTAIGTSALDNNVSGTNNTAIGDNAGTASGALSNTISIGVNATTTIGNQCTIGNTNLSVINPGGNNVCDLGRSGTNEFKNGYFAGEMNIGSGIIDKTDFSIAGDQELISKKYVDDSIANNVITCAITKSVSQSVSNGASVIISNWTTTDYNNGFTINLSTGVITVPTDGVYIIDYSLPILSNASDSLCNAVIEVNGSNNLARVEMSINAGQSSSLSSSTTRQLSANDTVNIRLFTDLSRLVCSGSSFENGHFSVTRILSS